MLKAALSVGIFQLFLSTVLWAGSFTARIDKTRGVVGDVFELTLSVNGSPKGKPEVPEIEGLYITSHGRSTNISIINGKMNKEITYNFAIEVEKPGSYTIPSLSLNVDGKVLKTVPITFEASEQSTSKKDVAKSAEPPVTFVERSFSNESPYVGEPVVETVTLYYRGRLEAQRVPSSPRGVRVFELEGEEHGREQVEGVPYDTVVVRRIIVPLNPGELSLAPFRVKARIAVEQKKKRRRGLDPWFQMFNDPFTKKITRMVSTGAASLLVKELPANDKPNDFTNIVGAFQIKSNLSQRDINVGDTTTLTITLAGEGLLDNLGELPWTPPEGIKAYPDQPEAKESPRMTGVYSSKTYRYALVPTQPGDIDLGRITLPIFNYKKGSYEFLELALGQISVEGEAIKQDSIALSKPNAALSSQKKVKAIATDLIDIKRNIDPHTSDSLTGVDFTVVGFITGAPLLLCLGMLGFRFNEKRKLQNPQLKKSRAAGSSFSTSLKELKGKIERDSAEGLIEELFRTYRHYLGDKFSIQGGSLTAKEIEAHLDSLELAESTKEKSRRFLTQVEALAYGGSKLDRSQIEMSLSDVESIVKEIEEKC